MILRPTARLLSWLWRSKPPADPIPPPALQATGVWTQSFDKPYRFEHFERDVVSVLRNARGLGFATRPDGFVKVTDVLKQKYKMPIYRKKFLLPKFQEQMHLGEGEHEQLESSSSYSPAPTAPTQHPRMTITPEPDLDPMSGPREFAEWASHCPDKLKVTSELDLHRLDTPKYENWKYQRHWVRDERTANAPVPPGFDVVQRRLTPDTRVRHAIYKATPEEWEYIRKKGLRPWKGYNMIRLSTIDKIDEDLAPLHPSRFSSPDPTPPSTTTTTPTPTTSTTHIYIFLDLQRAMREGACEFYRTHHYSIVSPGNELGYIPTEYFKDAVEVTIENTTVPVEAASIDSAPRTDVSDDVHAEEDRTLKSENSDGESTRTPGEGWRQSSRLGAQRGGSSSSSSSSIHKESHHFKSKRNRGPRRSSSVKALSDGASSSWDLVVPPLDASEEHYTRELAGREGGPVREDVDDAEARDGRVVSRQKKQNYSNWENPLSEAADKA